MEEAEVQFISGIHPAVWGLWIVLGLTVGFGYNALTAWQERCHPEIPASAMVVLGTVLTLAVAGTTVVPPVFALLAGLTFGLTGGPMVWGDLVRSYRRWDEKRQAELQAERDAAFRAGLKTAHTEGE